MKRKFSVLALILCICFSLTSCSEVKNIESALKNAPASGARESYSIDTVPDFDEEPYVIIDDNVPDFSPDEITTQSYEHYGSLDSLGRCTQALACVSADTMPTGERQSIGSIKPSGWHTVKYENVDGKYLYNRCHLIGYQLTAENANERNLITGTRYLNVEGMLPFENEVAQYIYDTGNHVMYRVTPVFEGSNLVASGVHMEAYSVEDNGEGVSYNVYCYNIQPGISIDYATGDSVAGDSSYEFDDEDKKQTFIVNTRSKKFHAPDCGSVKDIDDKNKKTYTGVRDNLIHNGYAPCSRCNP